MPDYELLTPTQNHLVFKVINPDERYKYLVLRKTRHNPQLPIKNAKIKLQNGEIVEAESLRF